MKPEARGQAGGEILPGRQSVELNDRKSEICHTVLIIAYECISVCFLQMSGQMSVMLLILDDTYKVCLVHCE